MQGTTIAGIFTADSPLVFRTSGRAVLHHAFARTGQRYASSSASVGADIVLLRCGSRGVTRKVCVGTMCQGRRGVSSRTVRQTACTDREGVARSPTEPEVDEIGPSGRWGVPVPDKAEL